MPSCRALWANIDKEGKMSGNGRMMRGRLLWLVCLLAAVNLVWCARYPSRLLFFGVRGFVIAGLAAALMTKASPERPTAGKTGAWCFLVALTFELCECWALFPVGAVLRELWVPFLVGAAWGLAGSLCYALLNGVFWRRIDRRGSHEGG